MPTTSRKRRRLKLKTKKRRSSVKRKKRSRSKHRMSPFGWVGIGALVLGAAGTARVLWRRSRGRKPSEERFLVINQPRDLTKETEYLMLTAK